MRRLELKATHKPVHYYYAALRQFDDLGITHETAARASTRSAWTARCSRTPASPTASGRPKTSATISRLGNRSALEWVIDQYQVSTDKRSEITNDPNRPDDPEYIVRLLGQVITVSLETVKVVMALPPLGPPIQS
jgi:hypothetical protein